MNDALLRLYHYMPSPLRSLAATMRGQYLKSWRFGRDSELLVAEALARERWSAAQWDKWREHSLAHVLERAATRVPYYRDYWAARRRTGKPTASDVLTNWPILEKETLRRQPRAFVADDCDIRRMFHEYTSGTTGKSLDLWWSRDAVRGWYALFEARCRRPFGVSRHDRWAMLAGQLVTHVGQSRPPFWVWNHALNQLYMSSYHLSPAFIPSYLEALAKYRVTHLSGYTSALYALAHEALRQKRRDLQMRVAITNAEPVFDYQRAAIAEAFGCRVCETYGQSEIVACASECEHGQLHVWPEVGCFEILNERGEPPTAGAGDVIGTSLMNADMPLIRYRLGDRAPIARRQSCPCGRTLPIMARPEGRIDDVLYTADGRQVGRLDPVFKAHLPVREAQIIQEGLRTFRIKYVPAPGFTPADAESIASRLRDRVGDVQVVLESVNQIPRSNRGKFRAVVCALSAAERQRLTVH
jgi:phenylacetate-CoA ligase